METACKKIYVKQLLDDLKLEVIFFPSTMNPVIELAEINRPGLQLTGYFDHFEFARVQVIGRTEYSYFQSLSEDIQRNTLKQYMSYDIPLLIVSNNLELMPVFIESAKENNVVIARSTETTTKLVSRVSYYLNENLAPEITIHGVLVDVDGVGILIIGSSGVGKSETALELVKKNHRLVADDAVRIIKLDIDTLQGRAPDMLEHFMEIRGLGILDIKSLYGIGAVKKSKKIDLIVELENWNDDKYYDRLGLEQDYVTILNTKVEKITIPVKPGRNTSTIIELAARNHRQKKMGYDAAKFFNEKLMDEIARKDK